MTDQENNLVGCVNPDRSKLCANLPNIKWRFVTAALTVDDDCGFSGCTRRGWLGIRVLFYRLDLAEVPALDGSRSLFSCVPPAVLDLDKLGSGCNLTVDECGELPTQNRALQDESPHLQTV
jgi:hypothetical protein